MAQSAFMPYLNLFGHSGTIRCLHLDGQLNRLFSGSADHTIKVRYALTLLKMNKIHLFTVKFYSNASCSFFKKRIIWLKF